MPRSRRIHKATKPVFTPFTPAPRILLLAIRQAIRTPLLPIAPTPALKEADPADAKASRQPARTPPSKELPPLGPPEFRQEGTEYCPERDLWVAVLKLAILDVKSKDAKVRRDALAFFESADFLKVLDYAGIDRDLAPRIRTKVHSLRPRQARTHALAA